MNSAQNHDKRSSLHKDSCALSKSNHPSHLAKSMNQYDLETEKNIRDELLRRSKHSYNIHAFAVVASIIISLTGCGLVLSGKTTEGAFTATAGLGATAYLAQTGKESDENLKALIQRLDGPQVRTETD